MALFVGSALCPSNSIFYSTSNTERVVQNRRQKLVVRGSGSGSGLMTEPKRVNKSGSESFGFKNLADTFVVEVQRAEGRALNVEIVKSEEKVENVGIRVELKKGCVGWGEVSVTSSQSQSVALGKVKEASDFLCSTSPKILDLLLHDIAAILPGSHFAPVRAGVEMALIDAVASSIGVPLWRLFGGVSNTLSTSITLPSAEAFELATTYSKMGFKVFKFRIGNNIDAEIKLLKAIQTAYPHISFILDAYEAYHPQQAIQLLHSLHDSGITIALLEQPVHRDDWKGLGEVSKLGRGKYGMCVGADESCRSLIDVQRVIKDNSAHLINVKLAKFGVMGALEIVDLARKSGIDMMISSTVETRLATGFAAHLAAGLGCFKFVGLDMPYMLSEDPVICGYEASGPAYKLLNARGQGGFLKWEFTAS